MGCRKIAGDTGAAMSREVEQLRQVLIAHREQPIEVQLFAALREARAAGLKCYARPAAYPMVAQSSSTTSNSYVATVLEREAFVVASISRATATAGALAQKLLAGGRDHIDSEMYADHLWDDETSDDPLPWPAPIVCNGNDEIRLEATGTNLSTTYITARGWHVDPLLAQAVRAAGELAAFGLNKVFAAAAVMLDTINRPITRPLDVERLFATETETSTPTRQSISIRVFDYELLPRGKVAIAPSLRKPGSRVDIPLRCNNVVQMTPHYTGDGVDDAVSLRTSWLGRRVA